MFWKIRPLHRVRGSGIVQEHPPDGAVNTSLLLPLDAMKALDPPGQRRDIPHRVVEHVQICASRYTGSELQEGKHATMKGQVKDLKEKRNVKQVLKIFVPHKNITKCCTKFTTFYF